MSDLYYVPRQYRRGDAPTPVHKRLPNGSDRIVATYPNETEALSACADLNAGALVEVNCPACRGHRVIVRPPANRLELTRGPGRAYAVGMTMYDLDNGLKVLLGIDLHELGDHFPRDQWPAFRADPFRFFMTTDDPTRRTIWAAFVRRHSGAVPE